MGLAAALAISLVLSLVIGLFSLRVKAMFYAMITLAVAAAFQTLASQLSDFTGGEDGLSFKNPALLSPSFEALAEPLLARLARLGVCVSQQQQYYAPRAQQQQQW